MKYWETHIVTMDWGDPYTMRMRYEEITCKFCGSPNIVKNGTRKGTQYWLCKNCGRGFVSNQALPKGKYPVDAVASALYLYFTGSSLNDIRRHTEQHYKILPSDSTIYSWVRKYTQVAQEAIKNLKPKVGDTWVADETVIKISGKNYWLWDIIDSDTRFLLATYLSPSRGTAQARKLMELASERAGKVPNVVVTDSLKSYLDGIELAFGSEAKHIQATPFSGTQLIERWHGTLKERTKVVWGLKKPETARDFLTGFLFFYNFLRPHESLNDETPAEAAGLRIPYKNWLDVVDSQAPVTQERIKRGIPASEIDFVVEHPRKPYRKRSKPKKKHSHIQTMPSITTARF